MADKEKRWYVLRAISGKEASVKEILDGQIKNSNLGEHVFQVLIPTEKVLAVRGGKKVVKERNLYSGYVFIEAALTPEVIYDLQNTTNVIDFLRDRSKPPKPEPLRAAEVTRMLGNADAQLEVTPDDISNFMVGMRVKVNAGPFAGFDGEIKDVNREKMKLTVVVKVFGRETPLELDPSQVGRD